MRAVSTIERFWLAYCACVIAAVTIAAGAWGAPAPDGFQPLAFVALHVAVAALQAIPVRLQRRGRTDAARIARCAIAIGGLPLVFTALALALPHANPEAWEVLWLRMDLAVLGGEATNGLRLLATEPVLAILQVVYAGFYAAPIVACVMVLRQRGAVAFDRSVAAVTGGFLLSYLGYLLFPTLGPKDVVPLDVAPAGETMAWLHTLLHEAEANHWDCFPSGHTMMSWLAARIAVNAKCRGAAWLGAYALAVAFSTLVLRYHWPIDAIVGFFAVPLWLRACDAMLDRDGAARDQPIW